MVAGKATARRFKLEQMWIADVLQVTGSWVLVNFQSVLLTGECHAGFGFWFSGDGDG
jgi:hypothetical protein